MPLHDLLHGLQDAAVRDLAWSIGSPALIDPHAPEFSGRVLSDAFFSARLNEAAPWLRELDRHPAALHAFLDVDHTHRLGRYFEQLLHYWLSHSGADGLRVNLQAGHTTGEFDFVFHKEAWGGWLHWETAVKFYLQASPDTDWAHFIGPNPQDRLSDKLHKLFDKQLKLGETTEGRAALGFDHALTPRAWVKGYLFHPAGSQPGGASGLSPQALSGWWLRHGSQALPASSEAPRWKLLHRLAWLAPARATEGDKTLFDSARMESIVARHFEKSHTPLLLAELAPDENGVWNEIARGFVVSAQWPDLGPDLGPDLPAA